MRALAAALAVALSAGCGIHYVTEECPQCRILNARLGDGERPRLPRLPRTTRRLFVIIPGGLGYSWEWNPAIKDLEAARKDGVEFVVFWWEPLGSVKRGARELAHWVNDLLGANDLPALEEVDLVAHSMGGVIAAYAAPSIVPIGGARMRLVTIGTAWAGMNGPLFGYPDPVGSMALFASFAHWTRYPAPPPDLEITEYRTTWPEDPVMEPRSGHDPAPPHVGPLPRTRIQLPHMDHNKCVALVVKDLLGTRSPPSSSQNDNGSGAEKPAGPGEGAPPDAGELPEAGAR